MPLIIHELIHFILSVLVGIVIFFLYKDINFTYVMTIALAGGFFIDVDHLIDYFIAYKWNFQTKKFFKGEQFTKIQKIFVLFHGYEYVGVLLCIGYFLRNSNLQAYVFTLAFSSLFHLIVDAMVNNVYVKTYSILYRLYHNFNSHKITPWYPKKKYPKRYKI